MNIDRNLVFSEDQALIATADSTNTLDTFNTTMGSGGPWYVMAIVTEDFATSTSYETEVQDSASESSGFAAMLVPITSETIAIATLVAGYVILRQPLPKTTKRYIKLVYTETGATNTAATEFRPARSRCTCTSASRTPSIRDTSDTAASTSGWRKKRVTSSPSTKMEHGSMLPGTGGPMSMVMELASSLRASSSLRSTPRCSAVQVMAR